MKKAQMEMIGLVIIVLIVIVIGGILLVISSKPKTNEDVTTKHNTYSILLAMLYYNTDCKGYSVSDLIEDCYNYGNIDCNGLDSCGYAKEQIQDILEISIASVKKGQNYTLKSEDYRFFVQNLDELSFGSCNQTLNVANYELTFASLVQLKLCV